jgi:hypothetical protein
MEWPAKWRGNLVLRGRMGQLLMTEKINKKFIYLVSVALYLFCKHLFTNKIAKFMRQLISIFHFPFSVLVLFSFFPVSMEAQSDPYFFKAWIETGGTSPSANFLNHFCSTTDGSGKTYSAVSVLNSSNTRSTQVTVRLSSGTVSWTQTFTLDATGDTYAGAITVDASGNVYLTGSAWNGSTNFYDLYLRKYNSSGTYQWQQTFNGTGSIYDGGAAVGCSSAGDVYVAGGTMQSLTDMDLLVRKYNSSGTLQWGKTWDNAGLIDAGTGLLISDGGITVAGVTQKSAAVWEYATVQYKPSDGTLLNSSVTNLGGTSIERITAGVQDAAGNYYLTGAMGASGQGLNIKTIKFDAGLNIVWTATYNGSSNHDDSGRGLAVDGSGNVYVAGYTKSTDKQAILLKYNSSGQQQWAKIADPEAGDDELAGVGFTSDNKLFAAGYQSRKGNRDIYAGMFDPSNGDVLWSDWYNGINNKNDEIANIIPDGSGNFTVSGWSDGTAPGGGKVIDIKYQRHTLVQPSSEKVYEAFTGNRGQLLNTDGDPEPSIRYYSRSTYPNTYLTDSRVSYVFSHLDTIPSSDDTLTCIDLTFPNSSNTRPPLAAGLEEQDWHYNYYLPHIPDGRERVPSVNKVLFADIYANTDAIFGHGQDGLFIRLICKPGSTPSDIKLRFSGQTSLSILSNGSLKAETILEDLIIPAPTAIFIAANGTETAASWTPAFSIGSNGDVSVSTGTVPSGSTLVIKSGREREEDNAPCNLFWSTYFGDTNHEVALGNDVRQENGDMFFTGNTTSPFFPVSIDPWQGEIGGVMDVFVAKFMQPDIKSWITFYGGNELGGKTESGFAVKYNPANESVYCVGKTCATDFPLWQSSGYFDDVFSPVGSSSRGFILKFNSPNGILTWGTFFGEPNGEGGESVLNLEILSNGNAVIVGESARTTNTFPFSNTGFQQDGEGIIAEFTSENELLWATRLSYPAYDIAEGANNDIWVLGYASHDTEDDFLPSGAMNTENFHGGISDAYVMRFNSSRNLIWGSFIGGVETEYPNSIVTSPDGSFYISGTTSSIDFPVKSVGDPSDIRRNNATLIAGENNNIFVSKFAFDGSLIWSRFFNYANQGKVLKSVFQANFSVGNAMSTDGNGTIFLTGYTFSSGFKPLVKGSECSESLFYDVIKPADAFMIIIDPQYYVAYSTFWGGTGSDRGWTISHGINPDNNKNFVIIGGGTTSGGALGNQIPLCKESSTPYYVENLNGQDDAFISKVYFEPCLLSSEHEPVNGDGYCTLFPNPASDILYLKIDNKNIHEAIVRIFDATGKEITVQKVYAEIPEGGVYIINVKSLTNGVYFINIASSNSFSSLKFIK